MSFRAAILLSADSKMALVVRSVFQHTELQGGVFMKPKVIKKALKDTIQAMTDCSWLFSARPGKDNTRNRKFPFQKVVSSILAFGSRTLNHEIMDFFGLTLLWVLPQHLSNDERPFSLKRLHAYFSTLRKR